MGSNSRLVSLLQRKETNTAENEKAVSNDGIAGSASATSESELISDEAKTFADVFIEDILPVIFDNLDILTAKDLLHFRLVNRSWRNAATSVILKHQLCEIALNFGKVVLDVNAVGQVGQHKRKPERNFLNSYKYFNVYQPTSFLQDLSKLISTSPKFPANSIRFHSGCSLGFGNLCPSNYFSKTNQHKKELFHFFSMYGKQIKKLSLTSGISKKAVQNLLYIHLPNLICLDLQDFEDFSSQDQTQEGIQQQVCLPPPSTLKIKVIWIGHMAAKFPWSWKQDFVKELMSAAPSLSDVRNVDASSLEVLLEIGKSHLIKDLHFDPRCYEMPIVMEFGNFLIDTMMNETLPRLRLSNLTARHIGEHCIEHFVFLVKVLNVILSASKDSLKYLDLIIMCSSDKLVNLFIPPLPHLKCLTLNDYRSSFTTRIHFLGDIIGEAMKAGEEVTADESVYDFDSNYFANSLIPADYFPRLRTVKLYGKEIENNSSKLTKFFSLEHLRPVDEEIITVPGDTLLTVTTLELITFPHNDRNLPKLFPNVSHLKLGLSWPSSNLRNWVWCAFPKLERFEIVGLCHDWDTNDVDRFFTGIPHQLCAKIEGDLTSTELDELISPPVLDRTQSYIGKCENLKEFRINFRHRLGSKFASKVTAAYAFQEVVYRTKIIFSFEDLKMSEEDIEETYRYLDPVATYVEIRMK